MTSNEDAFADVFDKIYQNAQFGTSICLTMSIMAWLTYHILGVTIEEKHSRHDLEKQVT